VLTLNPQTKKAGGKSEWDVSNQSELPKIFKARNLNPQVLYGGPMGVPEVTVKPATKF